MAIKHDYLARAAAALAEAQTVGLANVRERCLRSAAAWTEMADRLERTETLRAERDLAGRDLEGAAIATSAASTDGQYA